MKNVKKLLKKAMVFTVAASMLVGTPLTASAAGIRGVYSISDGINENESGTGTVTNTDTNSGVLANNAAKIIGIVLDKDNVNAVKGKQEKLQATIVLDDIEELTAEEETELRDALAKKIRWEVSNANGSTDTNPAATVSITSSVDDRTVAWLNPRKGTKKGQAIRVTAKIDGSYYFATDENGDLVRDENGKLVVKEFANEVGTYKAYADVTVKEYSDSLELKGMPTPYLKHVVNLDDYLVRTPLSANDDITWISTDTKIATVTAAGVVTFKKVGKGSIIAVGETGANTEWVFTVEAGEQSSKIEIVDDDTDLPFVNGKNQKKKADVDLNDGDRTLDANVIMYKTMKVAVKQDGTAAESLTDAEDGKKNNKYTVKNVAIQNGHDYVVVTKENGVEKAEVRTLGITDTVTWTSNKPAIVSVDANDSNDGATLTAKAVGTAVITAKASSGKSDKLTVTVKATLSRLEITNDEEELYSGQSLQMTFERTPEENKDAVKWSIKKVSYTDKNGNVKEKANPNATINAKGLLKIKPKLDLTEETYRTVTVVLQSKTTKTVKENGKDVKVPLGYDEYEIPISQSSIDGILVTDDQGTQIAEVALNSKGKVAQVSKGAANTTPISVPKNRTYTAKVTPSTGNGYENYAADESTLTWTTSNAKIASVEPAADGTAKITAIANGTATITVSGIRAVNKEDGSLKSASVIKTTFKVSVKQPVKTVTLNKPTVVLNEKLKNAGKSNQETLDQKVALKATLGPKGVKKEDVSWSVVKIAADGTRTNLPAPSNNKGLIKTANVTVTLTKPVVGDVFEITARVASGASATSTVKIVSKTTGVAIAQKSDLEEGKPVLFTTKNKANKDVANTKNAEIGDTFKMYTFINTSSDKNVPNWQAAGYKATSDVREDVTYSVNKKGIVNIDSDGTVHVINSGTVTITAKTPLNKKATLKVTVTKPVVPQQ